MNENEFTIRLLQDGIPMVVIVSVGKMEFITRTLVRVKLTV